MIRTFTRRTFNLANPSPADVDIEDIAASLSKTCRWVGHTDGFYSVAEHSILVSRAVPPEHALAALMHDSAEAYCGDVSRPLKELMGDAYRVIEKRIWGAIVVRYWLDPVLPECVKEADDYLLALESHYFMGGPGVAGPINQDLIPVGLPNEAAKELFLRRWHHLWHQRAEQAFEESLTRQPVVNTPWSRPVALEFYKRGWQDALGPDEC